MMIKMQVVLFKSQRNYCFVDMDDDDAVQEQNSLSHARVGNTLPARSALFSFFKHICLLHIFRKKTRGNA